MGNGILLARTPNGHHWRAVDILDAHLTQHRWMPQRTLHFLNPLQRVPP
jgi:hypothetical protein